MLRYVFLTCVAALVTVLLAVALHRAVIEGLTTMTRALH